MAPNPELEEGLRPDPEQDPEQDPNNTFYIYGYRRRPYSNNQPWTQLDLDKKTKCTSCGISLYLQIVWSVKKFICNSMLVNKEEEKNGFGNSVSPFCQFCDFSLIIVGNNDHI